MWLGHEYETLLKLTRRKTKGNQIFVVGWSKQRYIYLKNKKTSSNLQNIEKTEKNG